MACQRVIICFTSVLKDCKKEIWGKERGFRQMEYGIDRWMDRLGNLSIGILQTLPKSLLRALCPNRDFCTITNWAKTTYYEPYGSPDTYHAELRHLGWALCLLTSKSSVPPLMQSRGDPGLNYSLTHQVSASLSRPVSTKTKNDFLLFRF